MYVILGFQGITRARLYAIPGFQGVRRARARVIRGYKPTKIKIEAPAARLVLKKALQNDQEALLLQFFARRVPSVLSPRKARSEVTYGNSEAGRLVKHMHQHGPTVRVEILAGLDQELHVRSADPRGQRNA